MKSCRDARDGVDVIPAQGILAHTCTGLDCSGFLLSVDIWPLTSSLPLTGISLLLLCYSVLHIYCLPSLCFSREHSSLSINKVLLIVNQAGLELTMVKGKMGFLPLLMLVYRLLPHLLTSILTFSLDKAAGLTSKSWFQSLFGTEMLATEACRSWHQWKTPWWLRLRVFLGVLFLKS